MLRLPVIVALGVLALAKLIPAGLVENNPFNQSASQKLISSAREGHAEAQYDLVRSYQNGIGVKQNNTEAAFWYRRAAKQGHSEAQNSRLGFEVPLWKSSLIAVERTLRCCRIVRVHSSTGAVENTYLCAQGLI